MWASESPRNVSVPSACGSVTSQTWLAQPRTLLASLRSAVGQRRQPAAEVDDVAIALLPVAEQLELGVQLVKRRGDGQARRSSSRVESPM